MSWYDLDEVMTKADLPEVARRLGLDVERRGANLVTKCLFHEDTRPSLVLYPQDPNSPSHFHCFTCSAHGYAVDLVKKAQGVEFVQAIEWLAHNLGIAPSRAIATRSDLKGSTRSEALGFAQRVFENQHDEASFLQWCQNRRFDRDFLYGLGLRYLPARSVLVQALRSEGFGRQQELIDGLLSTGLLVRLRPHANSRDQILLDLNEQFRDYFHDGRVLIPIRSTTNDVIGFAGRFTPAAEHNFAEEGARAKYLLTPGLHKSDILYNAHQAQQAIRASVKTGNLHPVLYVVEGFLDALRLQAMNIPAVAVMGASLSEEQRKGLVKIIDAVNLPGGAHLGLRLFFDRDSAGFDGAVRATRQLLGLSGVATEWIGFGDHDNASLGKDPDEILSPLNSADAMAMLDQSALPAVGILVAANLGFKDATPLQSDQRWDSISAYPRERALMQAARAVRALSGASVDWAQRLEALAVPRPLWVENFLGLLRPSITGGVVERAGSRYERTFLVKLEAQLNYARMLAEHGARRGELPCDDETWRALDRNAQIFNTLAQDRLKQPAWKWTAPCDAVHLPRKLTDDDKVLSDPRRKVMPHAADLQLQQFLMNELLTERHDFSHDGPRSFSDCIPAVRWFQTEGEARVTGYFGDNDDGLDPSLHDDERGVYDEPVLSFAYQIDMEVLEGRRKPSDQGMFRPYFDCWRDFMASLKRQSCAIGPEVHVLRLDVQRYYDNIQRYVVRDRLLEPIAQALTINGSEQVCNLLGLQSNNARDAAERLVHLLCGCLFAHDYNHPDQESISRSTDVIGIPQGPVLSAWIGTIAMFPVDAAARAFIRQSDQRHPDDPVRPRVGYARYVDDIVLLADSESRLNALRESVQAAAARLDLTLLQKGEPVSPGSPDLVMQQLNSGRALAPSVPVWEPPMVGDGETGWGMSTDEMGPTDRQSALHLLRHPSLLDDSATVHNKVRDALSAPDLRPSDLGKCARALWWQVAIEFVENPVVDKLAWISLWDAYHRRWNEVCAGHAWVHAFHRMGYDILFAIEGIDMLMDSTPSMDKGRPQKWIDQHQKALKALASAILDTKDVLQGVQLRHNRDHIFRRIKKVQWKALQRDPNVPANIHADPQLSAPFTLEFWLCQAAILLNRYDIRSQSKAHPLDPLPISFNPMECEGPQEIKVACEFLKPKPPVHIVQPIRADANACRIALQFLVANTAESPKHSRWKVLEKYGELFKDGLNSSELTILPPLPVEGAGMLAYAQDKSNTSVRLFAFKSLPHNDWIEAALGAQIADGRVEKLRSLPLGWLPAEPLECGLHRRKSRDPIGLLFETIRAINRARFAADLYEILHNIQQQNLVEGKERVILITHLAHEPKENCVFEVDGCNWYLISEPVDREQLGVSAWVRDGRGGLRGVSVPSGEYAHLWRLGWAVSDALDMALDLPSEVGASDDNGEALAAPHQIEDYLLREQLAKLRGTWIADAQVRDKMGDALPATIQRALRILRRFDRTLNAAEQVRLVLHTEAETRSMAMRLQNRGASDLRTRLHLLPALVLQRLPLSVLECLPLEHGDVTASLRTDLALLLAFAAALDEDSHGHDKNLSQVVMALDSSRALHIGVALAATGAALRGLVASAWGIARHRDPIGLSDRISIPSGWNPPDSQGQDPQQDYLMMRDGLRNDNWSTLNKASPWQWMLALLGILDSVAPQATSILEGDFLHEVYERLRHWQLAPPVETGSGEWAWPYDDMPAYRIDEWRALLKVLPSAVRQIDRHLGVVVRDVEALRFGRHRNENIFTDAESQQWAIVKLQFTGLGSTDSVARTQRGRRYLPTWSEVRRLSDNELLSIHTLDDKLGRWWHAGKPLAAPAEHASDEKPRIPVYAAVEKPESQGAQSSARTVFFDDDGRPPESAQASNTLDSDGTRQDIRAFQLNSWLDRGKLKCLSHMRVAMLQWRIDDSYRHPLAEVGMLGMGMPEPERMVVRKALVEDSSMMRIDNAAVRGKEFTWHGADAESVPSWPEHRRRRLLKRALEACSQLKVDLLVLPEVSVRRETVDWLERQLQNFPAIAVLAGTYRHFGLPVKDKGEASATIHPLMAPLTLLWRPDADLSKILFEEPKVPQTLRFWRGKKYRAIAANELFCPDWNQLQPLFRIESLLDQLSSMTTQERQKMLLKAVAESMPPLRFCMELICSELFLLTSPANVGPLTQEMAAMLKRFPPSSAGHAGTIVDVDYKSVGDWLSIVQKNSAPRRTVLLVPAATKRSNDYWHTGQASVLASGTATVFCNAAHSAIACGGSCFIGVDSTTKPQSDPAGLIAALTPYHGWRKGILTAHTEGALSEADQALVVADIDPVHVVIGRPRPQLLPEPMALVAYLPIVELLDAETNKVAVYQSLLADSQIKATASVDETQSALKAIATFATFPSHQKPIDPHKFWCAFRDLRDADSLEPLKLEEFVNLFCDPKAVRERLLTWAQDRHQQPSFSHALLKREPTWLDFLDVDLTLKEGQPLPRIAVPPWSDAVPPADNSAEPERGAKAADLSPTPDEGGDGAGDQAT